MRYGLNIGCGQDYRPSTPEMQWVNVDADPRIKADHHVHAELVSQSDFHFTAFPVCYDEIVAIDILEHIPYNESDKEQWRDVLKNWCDLLAPGGTITIQVPSLANIAAQASIGAIQIDTAIRVIYGESTNRFDRHYQVFNKKRLAEALTRECGLSIQLVQDVHVNIKVTAVKP